MPATGDGDDAHTAPMWTWGDTLLIVLGLVGLVYAGSLAEGVAGSDAARLDRYFPLFLWGGLLAGVASTIVEFVITETGGVGPSGRRWAAVVAPVLGVVGSGIAVAVSANVLVLLVCCGSGFLLGVMVAYGGVVLWRKRGRRRRVTDA